MHVKGSASRPANPCRGPRPARIALIAGATLAAWCAAGCAPASPAGPQSGLQRQVVNGERISAASRAQDQRGDTGPASTPAPAAAPRAVGGEQVTAIGDSVMAASAIALESVLPGIYIDAQPSRQMPAGLDVVRRLVAAGRVRRIVVMGLGTNYIVTAAQLRELVALIGPHRKLVLINTYVPDEWSKEVNATMASFVRRHPSVILADWFDIIRHRANLLWPDHVHPMMPGTRVYARMVYRAVQETRNAPDLPSAPGL